MSASKNGDLRVWWIPQLGMGAIFCCPVESVQEGVKVMNVLAEYDLFQFNHNVKPDYCNAGDVQVFCEADDDWEDWYDEETGMGAREFVESQQ